MSEIKWLEVSMFVDGELAEAVSEVLSRYVSGGVAIESLDITQDPEGIGEISGPLRVCGYLKVDGELEIKQQRLEEALWHLGRIRELPETHYKPVLQSDWSENWKEHFKPIQIGKRLLIVPTWLEIEEGDRTVVRIDPGMAFGTGTHPTTQLCLEIIADHLSSKRIPLNAEGEPQHTMIDIGCGSGILSVAAVKLGIKQVLGVDLDAEAIEIAQQNAVINNVIGKIQFGLGSVSEILAGKFSLRHAPLIVANILAPVLVRLLGEGMGELITPKGRLILSGILEEQAIDVEAAIKANNLRLIEKRQVGDWVGLVVRKSDYGEAISLE